MMSKAHDTARRVSDAVVAEHAKRAEYVQSAETNKYQLKDTVWVERHHKDVLSRHRQQSWYIPLVILRKTVQDVYVIQTKISKTVEPDHTQLLPQKPDPHGCAITFELTAHAFDSGNDGERDEYTAEQMLSDKPDPRHRGDGYTRSDASVLLYRGTRGNFGADLCCGTRPCGWTTSRTRT